MLVKPDINRGAETGDELCPPVQKSLSSTHSLPAGGCLIKAEGPPGGAPALGSSWNTNKKAALTEAGVMC